MKPAQWGEYFLSGSYYLVGLAFFFLMVCPVIYLLFKVPTYFARPEIYLLTFLPYIVLSLSVFYTVMGTRNYRISDLFLGQLLGICTFSVYIRGAVSALLGVKTTFGITQKTRGKAIPYPKLWPQLTMILLNFIAIVWGINRFIHEKEPAVLVNGFWALYHFMGLSAIFYFNEEDTSKITCKRLKKGVKLEYKIIEDTPKLESLDKGTWGSCFAVFLPERLKVGALVMCKIYSPNKDIIIFEGAVIWTSKKRSGKGFETSIGAVTVSEEDRNKLRKVMRK